MFSVKTTTISPLQHLSENHYSLLVTNGSLSDFHLNDIERLELENFQKECFVYVMLKHATAKQVLEGWDISLESVLKSVNPNQCSASTYTYLNVLDQNADCKDTIADVLSSL